MARSPTSEGGPASGVTTPPRLQPKPSRILQIQAEAWQPDPAELAARDAGRALRLEEWKRTFRAGAAVPERLPTSHEDDTMEELGRSGTRLPRNSSGHEFPARSTSSASSTAGASCRKASNSNIAHGGADSARVEEEKPLLGWQLRNAVEDPLVMEQDFQRTPSRSTHAFRFGSGDERSTLGKSSSLRALPQEDTTSREHDLPPTPSRYAPVKGATLSNAEVRGSRSATPPPSRSARSGRHSPARPMERQLSARQLYSSSSLQGIDGIPGGNVGSLGCQALSLHAAECESWDQKVEKSAREDYLSRPVCERLCDSRYYPGTHRYRFEEVTNQPDEKHERIVRSLGEFGGIQGYKSEAYLFPRASSSPRRSRLLDITAPSQMVAAEFVTPVKVILVFRNGDRFHDGDRIVVHRHIRSMGILFKKLTEVLKPCCPYIELYDAAFVKVTRVDELEHGEKYLACEGKGPTSKRHVLSKFITAASMVMN